MACSQPNQTFQQHHPQGCTNPPAALDWEEQNWCTAATCSPASCCPNSQLTLSYWNDFSLPDSLRSFVITQLKERRSITSGAFSGSGLLTADCRHMRCALLCADGGSQILPSQYSASINNTLDILGKLKYCRIQKEKL